MPLNYPRRFSQRQMLLGHPTGRLVERTRREGGAPMTGYGFQDILRLGVPALMKSKKLDARLVSGLGQASFAGSALAAAAQLANTSPGLSRGEFEARLREIDPSGGDIKALYRQYQLLTGGTAPTSAEEVTSPEPEGPGRFSATRPGDLIPSSPGAPLRFGANG